MADDTHEACQITRAESHCVNYRVALHMCHLQLTSQVTWHGFLRLADDLYLIYASAVTHLRDMQLLGARAHNFLLSQSAMTWCYSPRLDGTLAS